MAGRRKSAPRKAGQALPKPAPPPTPANEATVSPAAGRRGLAHMLAAVLLIAHVAVALSAVRGKSTTFDEVAHLAAGTSYWLRADYRLQPENGVWPQRWVALPLVWSGVDFPTTDEETWRRSSVYPLGMQFFYGMGNDADDLLFRGRAMTALLSAVLGLVVYGWSRSLFGAAGGLLSLALYCFCPTTLAHGSLATSDMAAALGFLLAAGATWRLMQRVSLGRLLAAAAALALLALAKYSAVLFAPMAVVMLLARVAAGRSLVVALRGTHEVACRGRQSALLLVAVATQGLLAVAMVWAAYGFRYSMFAPDAVTETPLLAWHDVLKDTGMPGHVVALARAGHLLPEAWLYGLGYTLAFSQGRNAFLNGEFNTTGWPWFFPYCLLVKTPPELFLVLMLAILAARRRWRVAEESLPGGGRAFVSAGLYATAPLWSLLVVYWAFAISSHLNIGQRHLLPTYPVMFILAGAAAWWWKDKRAPGPLQAGQRVSRAGGWILALALAGFIGESALAWPHYLAYFNVIAGGPSQGYRHLVDSSLDWGQELKGLARWLDAHGPPPGSDEQDAPVYLAYFGTGSPEHEGIAARPLPSFVDRSRGDPPIPLTGGTYCVSATMLQQVYSPFPIPWTAAHERAWQDTLAMLRQVGLAADDPAARQALMDRGDDFWRQVHQRFEQLRFARLCHFLRQREPDDQVGYSILIYRLTDRDIDRALFGPWN